MWIIEMRLAGQTSEWRPAYQHGEYSSESAARAKLAKLWVVPGFAARVAYVGVL